jgi:hypothetical protein
MATVEEAGPKAAGAADALSLLGLEPDTVTDEAGAKEARTPSVGGARIDVEEVVLRTWTAIDDEEEDEEELEEEEDEEELEEEEEEALEAKRKWVPGAASRPSSTDIHRQSFAVPSVGRNCARTVQDNRTTTQEISHEQTTSQQYIQLLQ